MVTNEERVAQYAAVIADEMDLNVRRAHDRMVADEIARAVMAVADAEQAELRAEVERLGAVADASASLAESLAERLRMAWYRAEAAEAKVARVEAEARALEELADELPTEASGLRLGARSIRAALDGDA